jgi:hypothetical protein
MAHQVEYKVGSFKRQWIDLIGYEDYYFIEPMDGLIVKKKTINDDPNTINSGSGHRFIEWIKTWDKVRLNRNGILTEEYVVILLAKMFVPNPNNYRFVEWKYSNAWSYTDEIKWVENKTVNSREAVE